MSGLMATKKPAKKKPDGRKGAPKGNQFWKQRTKHGRDKLFASPDILLQEAFKYFKWCDDNPLEEQKAFHAQGEITKTNLNKLRAYTWEGLELYLGIYSLRNYKTDTRYIDFQQVMKEIERVIYHQKFSGAAADLLNPKIIARDLGLADKKDVRVKDDTKRTGDELDNKITELQNILGIKVK